MAEEVLSATGLDIGSLDGNIIIGVLEESGSDAHFVLSCLLSKYVENDFDICLVTLHHTFNHYHNVGMKLGYNLKALKDSNHIRVIEPMKAAIKMNTGKDDHYLDVLKKEIQTSTDELIAINNRLIVIVIDDLSHLFNLDFNMRDVLVFLKHIRSLVHCKPNIVSAIVNSHLASEKDLVTGNILEHCSNVWIRVSPLRTGVSADISGRMEVSQKNVKSDQMSWNKQNVYHYKLHDRRVRVFAPGLVS